MRTPLSNWPLHREWVMFVAGLAILAHETLLTAGDRYFLISAACALMGLPFVLAGERKHSGEAKPPSDSTP